MKNTKYIKIIVLVIVSCFVKTSAFAQTTPTITVTNVTTTPVCVGSDVTITFSTKNGNGGPNRFTNSTVYTIYLSDASGTGYTSQGTFSTSGVTYSTNNQGITSGITQIFNIPGASVNGSGYRISLSSMAPTFNGSTGTGSFGPFTISALPTTANAGPDQTSSATCGLTQVTLAANTATSGTGQWSIVSGIGGSFGNDASPTSTFSGNAGESYTLRWTISNSPCIASTDDVDITFYAESTDPSNALADQSTVCPNTSVEISVVGGSLGTGANWVWYEGSCGSTLVGNGSIINVNPSTTTTYYVRAEGACNNTNCAFVTVTVDPGPPSSIPGNIAGNLIVCNGATGVQYSVNPATNAVSYNWTLPPGATIASGAGTRIITVDYPDPIITGTVCVSSENSCVIPSAARCITVSNVSNFTPNRIVGDRNVCPNVSGLIYYTLNTNGATNFNWTLPAGMTITSGAGTSNITVETGPSVTPGPMCVSVDNACGTSQDYCINITAGTTITPGGITGVTSVCGNTNGLVYSVSPITGATSYNWTVPSGFTIVAGAGTRFITVDVGPSPSGGNVCVSAQFPCGASNQKCKAVAITGATPSSISGTKNVCGGTMGIPYSVTLFPNATSYNWTFPPGITQASGGNTNAISVNFSTGFLQGDICVTVTSNCGTSSAVCITLTEFGQVLPGGITGPNVICQNTSGLNYSVSPVPGAVSYVWSVPSGFTITSGLNTRSITVDVDNTYTIGDIGVRAVAACASESQIRWNNNITTINPGLSGSVLASAPVCPSTSVMFSVTSMVGISTYAWTLPQGMSFTAGPPTNTNSVSVDIGAGFTQGEICVRGVSVCGVEGYMRCNTFNVNPATPNAISGPSGVCPGATGIVYSVAPAAGAVSYEWDLPSGWNITAGSGTNSITVTVAAGFIQGQIRVNAVSSCGSKSGTRSLNVNQIPATPGTISGPSAICAGNTYLYSIVSVSGADSYLWTLPAGVSFTAGPPTNTNAISVDVDGGYSGGQLCVTASTACGEPSAQKCITLGITPGTPGIIAGPAAVCQGANSVVYSIDALTGISDYNWIVPAGINIVSGQGTTSLTVDISGGFTSGQLCVEAENACGTPGISSCLDISLTPGSASSITPQVNFCPGSTRSLTINEVSGAIAYSWSLPVGLTLVSGQGSTSIMVLIDDAFVSGDVCVTPITSCLVSGLQYCENITGNPSGDPVSIASSSQVCAGSNVVFSLPLIAGAGSYSWSLPSGLNIISGQGSPSLHASADPGFTSGDVCVTTSSGCGVSGNQYCQNFSVTPAATGNIAIPASVCSSDPEVIFSVPVSQGISSYNWSVTPEMTITSGQGSNAITVSTSAGFTTGQVSVAAVSSCLVQGAVKSINVGSTLGTPGTITRPVSVCPNSTGLVFSVPQVIGAVSYVWTLPGEFTVTAGTNTNSITVDVGPGFTTGQICVSAVSACGIPGTQRCVTINYLPNQPSGVAGPTRGVCGQTHQYNVATAVGAVTYTWAAPVGATITNGQGTKIITVEFSPSFTSGQLSVFTTNACGNSAVRLSPLITGAPDKPAVINGPASVCNGEVGVAFDISPVPNATGYTWTVPAGATITNGQGTALIIVTWGATGGNVSVTANNACGSSAVLARNIIVNCRLSNELQSVPNISVYPRPAKDEIIIRMKSEYESNYSIELYNLAGRLIKDTNENLVIGTNYFVMDVRALPRGIYIVKISGADGILRTEKVILQ